jgi:hypothetical protein
MVRNCTGDEGRPFEVGNQVLVSSHRKPLSSKARVVSIAESRDKIPAGMVERGERKRTAAEVSKAAEDANKSPGLSAGKSAVPSGPLDVF